MTSESGRGGWNKGIKGYTNTGSFKKGRVPWNKGLKGVQVPWNKGLKGLHSSPETEFKKGHPSWNKGKPYPHEGCPRSEKTRKKISETRKRRFADGTLRVSEETKQKIREARLNQVLPTKDTSIEILMQDELRRRGIAFQTHVPLCGICQPDIVIPEKRIVIHCDGDYWHSLPKTKIKDKSQDKILRKAGWKVYRFWEHEINNDVESCVNQIMA